MKALHLTTLALSALLAIGCGGDKEDSATEEAGDDGTGDDGTGDDGTGDDGTGDDGTGDDGTGDDGGDDGTGDDGGDDGGADDGGDDGSAATGAVRLAHFGVFPGDTGTEVDIFVNGANSGITFGFKDTTGFVDLPVGTYDFDVVPSGGTIEQSVYSVPGFEITENATWSIFAAGYVDSDAGNGIGRVVDGTQSGDDRWRQDVLDVDERHEQRRRRHVVGDALDGVQAPCTAGHTEGSEASSRSIAQTALSTSAHQAAEGAACAGRCRYQTERAPAREHGVRQLRDDPQAGPGHAPAGRHLSTIEQPSPDAIRRRMVSRGAGGGRDCSTRGTCWSESGL